MNAIYNSIGDEYDVTRKADPEILSTLADIIRISHDGQYLDVACGTGNYTAALAAMAGRWKAIDQSEVMLVAAQAKSEHVSWHLMDATKIQFTSNSFDGAVCTLAIHHFPDIYYPFSSIARVLKPGTHFAIFTSFPSQMRRYWLCYYFPKMMERACEQMPDEEQVMKSLNQAGLILDEIRSFEIKPELEDFFLYSGKQRPEMYLSQSVRSGISSFRNGFCSNEELHSGLASLEKDINSGDISSVISRYANQEGDYSFVVARKPN